MLRAHELQPSRPILYLAAASNPASASPRTQATVAPRASRPNPICAAALSPYAPAAGWRSPIGQDVEHPVCTCGHILPSNQLPYLVQDMV